MIQRLLDRGCAVYHGDISLHAVSTVFSDCHDLMDPFLQVLLIRLLFSDANLGLRRLSYHLLTFTSLLTGLVEFLFPLIPKKDVINGPSVLVSSVLCDKLAPSYVLPIHTRLFLW